MRLAHNAHLSYCTNIHPGNDWPQTLHSLKQDVLAVRAQACPDKPYAIGLRLSAQAANQLAVPAELSAFQRWLEENNCYVFTINGFPYGNFHGERVKEQVYRPDWSSPDRLAYTNLLFDLLVQLLPSGISGSVSTLPGSFKRFITTDAQHNAINDNLYRCFQHIETLSNKHNIDLHLGLEPEPLGLFETTKETVAFFDRFLIDRPDTEAILNRIGVNYDTCHLAVEYENAKEALARLTNASIRVSKIHLSSALALKTPTEQALETLSTFCEDTYLHQVIARETDATLTRYEDLDQALTARRSGQDKSQEWRIHFHIPLHASPQAPLEGTENHLLDTLDVISENPTLCQHFEMETYTWAVLPNDLHNTSVVDQLVKEYQWLLPQLKTRNLL